MASKKSFKRSITASVVSLVLCFAMLLGTTFAWFSTTVTSSVNSIKSGSLTIDLVDAEGNSLLGKTLGFVNADKDTVWEPGCTYALDPVYIKNTGNVAVKYKIEVIGIDGDNELMQVIDWTVKSGTTAVDLDSFTATLNVGETSTAAITIEGSMRSTAGNKYQNLTADGIAIAVYATQAAVESDSFSSDYDAAATFAQVAAATKELDEMPTVTTADGLTKTLETAYTFTAVDTTDAEKYADWLADYVITFDKDVKAGEVLLAGQYDSWSPDWVATLNPDDISANTSVRLLKDYMGTNVKYSECLEYVKAFNCGAASNGVASGTTMTVQLRLYERVSGVETGEYLVAGTYTYTF